MIRWSKRALDDLHGIFDYIASDSVAAAARQCGIIEESVQQLADFPFSGRKSKVPGDRMLAVAGTKYILIYRLKDSDVLLRRIRHGGENRR